VLKKPLASSYLFCRRAWEEESLPRGPLRARTDPGWRFRELDAGHLVLIADPQLLVDALLDAAD
jgi:hypothetical protein